MGHQDHYQLTEVLSQVTLQISLLWAVWVQRELPGVSIWPKERGKKQQRHWKGEWILFPFLFMRNMPVVAMLYPAVHLWEVPAGTSRLVGEQICPQSLEISHEVTLPSQSSSFLSGCCRNLSEPVMTYKLHKELVLAASKYSPQPDPSPQQRRLSVLTPAGHRGLRRCPWLRHPWVQPGGHWGSSCSQEEWHECLQRGPGQTHHDIS